MAEKYIGIIETDGGYYHIVKNGNKLIAGSATNVGLIPEIELEYDTDEGMDENLTELYYLINEAEFKKHLTTNDTVNTIIIR